MTALILAPLACSAAVGGASLLGIRPIVTACCMPAVVAAAWCLS